jgi:protein phosphatase
LTDVGRARERNEDSFAVYPHLGLFMVADGMGGHAGGEVASRMAIDNVREMFDDPDTTWPRGNVPPCRFPGATVLEAGIQLANARIFAASARDRALRKMGTTFVGALAWGDRMVIAHVGDSRCYRLRGRRLDLLTEDHSLVNDHIRAGILMPENAHLSPFRHAITRSVGSHSEVHVEMRVDSTFPGDVYLLCSDGLSNVVEPPELTAILLEQRDLCRAASHLVERANDLGGPDNVTAVLVRVSDSAR